MTEIKTGKAQQEPDSPPACRCQCAFEGPWFPLEFQAEALGLAQGACGCACTQATVEFTMQVAQF